MTTQQAIDNATFSMEMEGFEITSELKELCKKRLENKISQEEYIKFALKLKGVKI